MLVNPCCRPAFANLFISELTYIINLKIKNFFTKNQNATKIPVPAAYNDLSFERDLQNHVGWVWYQRHYWLPSTLINNQNNRPRSFLHFGSVQYFAIVYLNGKEIGRHVGGHLPFQFELELIQNFPNLITVAVNNTLSSYTIPPGEFNIINL
ncbi:unnamed protein product [Meloidogyne enterolobii]